MKSAIGIVAAIVKTPHGLSASALTTHAEAGERDDDDEEDRDRRDDAGERADLLARDLGERRAVAPRRRPQDDEVVDRAARHDADDEPEEPGQKPNCAASTGPMSGPAPVIAAKWWPKSTHRGVG